MSKLFAILFLSFHGSLRVIAEHPEHTYSIIIYFCTFVACVGLVAGIGFQRTVDMLCRLLIKTLSIFAITVHAIYGIWLISYVIIGFLVGVSTLAGLISFILGLPIFILFGFM